MKTIAFASALIASANAWGYSGYSQPSYQQGSYAAAGAQKQGASAQYGAKVGAYDNDQWAKQAYGQDYDSRWGKSYDSVDAKSYDNTEYERNVAADDDQYAFDYDTYNKVNEKEYDGAASYGYKGPQAQSASYGYSAPSHGYGHGYSAPSTKATYGKYDGGYAQGASAQQYGGIRNSEGKSYDAWGRDQDLQVQERFSNTNAKSYGAESYDEWDNTDNDKYGAQSWGKDQDVYGASSYGKAASAGQQGAGAYNKYGYQSPSYGYGHGHGYQSPSYGYGQNAYGAKNTYGASAQYGAKEGAYDNDQWAKQSYGQDYDSRWGKSYDSVDAKSYDNTEYERNVAADDDQYAFNFDKYEKVNEKEYDGAASYGYKAPSAQSASYGYSAPSHHGHGHGYSAPSSQASYNKYDGGYAQGASEQGYGKVNASAGQNYDAWGRDQDLQVQERFSNTKAKSYGAESYDEWDNKDNDTYGAQSWGKDQDVYGASSYGQAASAGQQGAGRYNQYQSYQPAYQQSYRQPSYNSYSKPSYSSYQQPSYNSYSQPSYSNYGW